MRMLREHDEKTLAALRFLARRMGPAGTDVGTMATGLSALTAYVWTVGHFDANEACCLPSYLVRAIFPARGGGDALAGRI